MNFLTDMLGAIGGGLSKFLPELGSAIFDTFVALFMNTTADGSIDGLNPLALFGIAFIIVGMSIRFIPKILGWLSLSWSNRKKRRAARAAK